MDGRATPTTPPSSSPAIPTCFAQFIPPIATCINEKTRDWWLTILAMTTMPQYPAIVTVRVLRALQEIGELGEGQLRPRNCVWAQKKLLQAPLFERLDPTHQMDRSTRLLI
jgi:hypothetical protein